MRTAIASSVPTAVTPEQSATWAYPQGKWSDEINALTVINSMLGRIHLSGRLDSMAKSQLELVAQGMKVYKGIRQDLKGALPFWPLGLPAWHDNWIALGMKAENCDYVTVWRRGGPQTCSMVLRKWKGKPL
jgi:alpha-galactosidase